MADLKITARRQVRMAVLAALQGARLGCTIDSPGNWVTPPEKLPAIQLRATTDHKTGTTAGQAEFTTTVGIQLEAKVQAGTAEGAQDALEDLSYRVECAVLTNRGVLGIMQGIPLIQTEIEVSAEGRQHVGTVTMNFAFEVMEFFDPLEQSPVQPIALPIADVRASGFTSDGVVGIDIPLPQ
jgi:hypothetical protein